MFSPTIAVVMPGFVPGIHANTALPKDVDGRYNPGHDAERANRKRCVAGGPRFYHSSEITTFSPFS